MCIPDNFAKFLRALFIEQFQWLVLLNCFYYRTYNFLFLQLKHVLVRKNHKNCCGSLKVDLKKPSRLHHVFNVILS